MSDTTQQYLEKRRLRVTNFLEGQVIVGKHAESGIPLDPNAYPAYLRTDIVAGMLRLSYDTNLANGRYIDSPDEPSDPEQRQRLRQIHADEMLRRQGIS